MLERGFELSRDLSFPIPFSLIASALGVTYALSGRLAEAIPPLEAAFEQANAMKLMVNRPMVVTWLGEGYLLSNRLEDALRMGKLALDSSREQKERGHETYALRLLGEITAQADSPDIESAQGYYRLAMGLAEELGMRPLVARCHQGLGTLYRRAGSHSEAKTHLTAAIALFRAMGMQFWEEKAVAALRESR